MRMNLKLFRVQNKLSQEEISEKIGCQRTTYAAIECGLRSGRDAFWNALQEAFSIPDADMWTLKKDE